MAPLTRLARRVGRRRLGLALPALAFARLALRELAGELLGHLLQLRAREFQRLAVVAEHVLHRPFHSFSQFVDPGRRATSGLAGLGQQALLQQVLRQLQGLARAFAFLRFLKPFVEAPREIALLQQLLARVLHRLAVVLRDPAHAVVKLTRQQRLRVLGLFRKLRRLVNQVTHALLLFRQLFERGVFFRRLAERLLLRVVETGNFLRDFLLLAGEIAGLVSHLFQVLGELARAALPQFVAHLLQITLRPGARRQGLRDFAFARRIRGFLRLGARAVELIALLLHGRLILRPVHPLPHFVHVRHHLLLLVLQPLQLPPHFFFFLRGARLFERRLQLLEPFVHVLLPSRQLLQSVQNLILLPSLRTLRRIGLPLRLIAVLRLVEVEAVEFPLVALAVAALTPVAAICDAGFAGLQLEQRLIRRLLGRQRRLERLGRFRRQLQLALGVLHLLDDGRPERLPPGARGFPGLTFGLLQRLRL